MWNAGHANCGDLERTLIATVVHDHGVLFHTDAVQAISHIPVNVKRLGVDLLSPFAHKFNGPRSMATVGNGCPDMSACRFQAATARRCGIPDGGTPGGTSEAAGGTPPLLRYAMNKQEVIKSHYDFI